MLGYHKSATLATGVITAEVEARTATYFLFVIAPMDRLITDHTRWVEIASGKAQHS